MTGGLSIRTLLTSAAYERTH